MSEDSDQGDRSLEEKVFEPTALPDSSGQGQALQEYQTMGSEEQLAKLPGMDASVTDGIEMEITKSEDNMKPRKKRSRTSPELNATSTITNETIVTPTLRKLPLGSGNSPKKLKIADHVESVVKTPSLDNRDHHCSCSSVRTELATLWKKVEERLLGPVTAQLEKLQRDYSGLARSVVRINQTLSKMNPDHSLYDKLEPVSGLKTPLQPMPTITSPKAKRKPPLPNLSEPMDIVESVSQTPKYKDLPAASKLNSNKHWVKTHHVRSTQAGEKKRPEKPPLTPPLRNPVDFLENEKILTPDARLDIAIKEWAFCSDFKLPLFQTVNASITTISGELIANGYDRVIADGESLWLEIPRTKLLLGKLQARQRTSSRYFYTLHGATIHQQIASETSLCPRRHKLAVKVKRNVPSCRLTVGNWYVHAHQVRINTRNDDNRIISRRLGTNRLAKLLRTIFGQAYHPRTKTRSYHRIDSLPGSRINKELTRKPHEPAASTYLPIRTLTNYFPLPLQAPSPWPNQAYVNGQVPHVGLQATQNALAPQPAFSHP